MQSTLMISPEEKRHLSFFKRRYQGNLKVKFSKYLNQVLRHNFIQSEVQVELNFIKSTYGNIYYSLELKKVKFLKHLD